MGKYKKVAEIDYSNFDAVSSILYEKEIETDKNLQKRMESIISQEQLAELDEIISIRMEINKRLFPVFYLGVVKDKRNNFQSIVGKCNWVKDDGSRISLQVYCGKLADFLPLGIESPIAKKICLDKLRMKIKELFPVE